MVNIMTDENFRAVEAVKAAAAQIGEAVDAVTASFENNGRLFLIGAGTSGRLGVLDAAECPPTFGVSSDMVTGIIAGGAKCMFAASEGEEDNEQKGRADMILNEICQLVMPTGISYDEEIAVICVVGDDTAAITAKSALALHEAKIKPLMISAGSGGGYVLICTKEKQKDDAVRQIYKTLA